MDTNEDPVVDKRPNVLQRVEYNDPISIIRRHQPTKGKSKGLLVLGDFEPVRWVEEVVSHLQLVLRGENGEEERAL